MPDQVPGPPLADAAVRQAADPTPTAASGRPDGTVVIDLLAPVSPSADCAGRAADPFNPEILVCQTPALSRRLPKSTGPEIDDFGNAIPRERVKLFDKAEAEANLINKGVGGFNANGAEVRLRIEF